MAEKLTVVIDSNERLPWSFPVLVAKTKTKSLKKWGCDYTVEGYVGYIGVERKSTADYLSSITAGWRRFRKSIEKLRDNKFCAIIVEGNITDQDYKHPVPLDLRLHQTATISSMGVPVLFASRRELAEMMCWKFFHAAIKRIRES